jgi:pimeloyl-[acyl-carrier protein] methyl ester esterase
MQLIAMHGWAGDSHGWAPWRQACQARDWSWQSGDRGYGYLDQVEPHWNEAPPSASQRRVVIAHSMGAHLLPAEVLAQADAVVLLASFGRFIPEGKAGKRLRMAVEAMAEQLRSDRAETMLGNVLAQAAAPANPALLAPTPFDAGLSAIGRQRLSHDLDALSHTCGLPDGFPQQARVLLVEAGDDLLHGGVLPRGTGKRRVGVVDVRLVVLAVVVVDRLGRHGRPKSIFGPGELGEDERHR